jgi:hypothetical protein
MTKKATRPAAHGTDHHTVCETDDKFTTRVCGKCGEAKPLSEFANDRWKPHRRRGVCAMCRTNYDRERDYSRRARMYGHCPVVESFTTQQLIERHGDGCFHCGIGDFECIDHVVCVRVGGHHTLDNAVPSCQNCNQRKRWAVDEVLIRVYRLRFADEVAA